MNTYYFQDLQEGREIKAKSFRAALLKARNIFKYKGRLRLISYCGNSKEYGLTGSTYCFSLTQI